LSWNFYEIEANASYQECKYCGRVANFIIGETCIHCHQQKLGDDPEDNIKEVYKDE
jgi:hypothetical protein